jgi:hypothetical protein
MIAAVRKGCMQKLGVKPSSWLLPAQCLSYLTASHCYWLCLARTQSEVVCQSLF